MFRFVCTIKKTYFIEGVSLLLLSVSVETSSNNEVAIDSPECQVRLFIDQKFKDSPAVILRDSDPDLARPYQSIRVIGPCRWTFFSGRRFTGASFKVEGGEALRSPKDWGWVPGSIKSVRKRNGRKKKKKRKKVEF